ncbi:MAG: gamma-glutamyltransferase [Pseudomonadota bacterium]|nr:gamma-glutamyltransferase [Pseudomonadota bacterium]
MVATTHRAASSAAYDILQQGGNATDALVTAQLVLNVVEPQSSGIGGGAFTLYWDNQNKRLTSIDGRETAPLSATERYFLRKDGTPMTWWEARVGGLSVGVPGTLKMIEYLHQKHGKLPWHICVKPAIELAKNGFMMSRDLENSLLASWNRSRLIDNAQAKRLFFDPQGNPKKQGTIIKNIEFANTLEQIAQEGSRPFYIGNLANQMINTIQQSPNNPGIMTYVDFASYKVRERPAVCITYRDYNICGMGSPSSGGLTVAQILGLMDRAYKKHLSDEAGLWHHYIEASKLAYADRNRYMADTDYVPAPDLLNASYLEDRAKLIDHTMAFDGRRAAGNPPKKLAVYGENHHEEMPSTTHISIIDSEGNIVSTTSTIESGFGSYLMAPGGYLLNNELTDFSLVPNDSDGQPIANRVQGGKRPRSSMSPTIIFDKSGNPVWVLGSPGGFRIIGYVANNIVKMIDLGMDPQQSINSAHIVNSNHENTEIELGFCHKDLIEKLESMGHKVKVKSLWSGLTSIQLKNKDDGPVLVGGVDARRGGESSVATDF